jgi:hypothetical protein
MATRRRLAFFLALILIASFVGCLQFETAEATTLTITKTFIVETYDGYEYNDEQAGYGNRWGDPWASDVIDTTTQFTIGQTISGEKLVCSYWDSSAFAGYLSAYHPSFDDNTSAHGSNIYVPYTCNISSVKLLLAKYGTPGLPTVNISVAIYEVGVQSYASLPTAAPLIVSNPVNSSELSFGVYANQTFTFSAYFTLSENTYYALVLRAGNSGTIDPNNLVYMRFWNTTIAGRTVSMFNNSAWSIDIPAEMCMLTMEVYGYQPDLNGAYIYRGFVPFDTSSITDSATITESILSLNLKTDLSTTNFNITLQQGYATAPHQPLIISDYWYLIYSGNLGTANTSTLPSINNYWNITLSSDGRNWIHKNGVTALALRSSFDINEAEPLGDQHVIFWSREKGESYAPILYVTYETEGYRYILQGPFYEDGTTPASTNVTVTLYSQYANPTVFIMPNGSSTYTIEVENRPNHFVWNISSASYNESRFYWLTDATYEEIYIFIPNPTEIYNLYTFSIWDFANIQNAYLETIVSVNGTERVIERQPVDSANPVPFYLTLAHHYTLKLTCNLGTYSWVNVIPAYDYDMDKIVSSDMFPTTLTFFNVTITSTRVNSTHIQTYYHDNNAQTLIVTFTILHRSGTSYVTDETTSQIGSDVTYDWYSANATRDYYMNITAVRTDGTFNWTLSVPQLPTEEEPMTGLWDMFGIWPIPSRYFVGMLIVFTVIALFSTTYAELGCVLAVIVAGMLNYIRWLNISWTLIVFAFAIAILYALQKAQKKEKYGA